MVPSHPTILIGYGRYGRTVLCRLLQEGYDQGVLEWEDSPEAEGPGARRLKNLALLWASGERSDDSGVEGDMARDLYSQIQEIAPSRDAKETWQTLLVDAAVAAKDRLLDASRRVTDRNRLRLGLDVIVLAQPVGREILGNLEDLLQPVMDALASDKSLERPAPGGDLLNFLLFLDFDSYWDSAEKAHRLRKELRASVERWRQRQGPGKPDFARIFLMDGQVKDEGRRPEALRMEEAVILLSFMLFEGLRDDPSLRSLFQREREQIAPLATFGIRVIERSSELLARLAAARFASGWLDYLAGGTASNDDIRRRMRVSLEEYRPHNLDFSDERRELDQAVEDGLRRVETELQDYIRWADDEDWSERVRSRATVALLELKSRLSAWAGERTYRIAKKRLSELPAKLRESVTVALQDTTHPAPLGVVMEEFRDLQRQLEIASPPAAEPVEGGDLVGGVAEVHREFLEFCRSQLNPTNLAQWWPLLALVAASAWTPVLLDALDDLAPPDPTSPFLIRKAYEGVMLLAHPWLMALLLAVLAWIVGRGWFEPQIRRWLERGRLVYTDSEQGKLIERLRRAIRSGPAAASITRYADQVYESMQQRVRGDIRREIARVVDRLQDRKVELQWLRREMREFLRTHGVDPDQAIPTLDSARAQQQGYRVAIERERDLHGVLRRNPTTLERYQSAQAEERPFEGWDERYCDTFLYPVVFLERLSKEYHEAPQPPAGRDAEEIRAARAREILDFLDKFGQFRLAFDWSTAPGAVANLQSYCILPKFWRDLPNVAAALSSHGYTENRVLEGHYPDRCYLVRVQLGVSLDRLISDVPERGFAVPEVPRI